MMIPVILQESGTAVEAKVIVRYRDRQTEIGRGNMIWTETGKDSAVATEIEPMILKVIGFGTVRRVEVERGMTMREIEAEKEIGIGGDE